MFANWLIKKLGWDKALTLSRNFSLSIKLHELEGQILEVTFDPFWGFLKIYVDGAVVVKDWQFLAKPLIRVYEHSIRDKENIRVEQERPSVWNGVNEKRYRVYLNDELLEDVSGY